MKSSPSRLGSEIEVTPASILFSSPTCSQSNARFFVQSIPQRVKSQDVGHSDCQQPTTNQHHKHCRKQTECLKCGLAYGRTELRSQSRPCRWCRRQSRAQSKFWCLPCPEEGLKYFTSFSIKKLNPQSWMAFMLRRSEDAMLATSHSSPCVYIGSCYGK